MEKHYAAGTWVQKPGEEGMTVSFLRNISEAEYERYKTIVGKFSVIQERKIFQFLERSSSDRSCRPSALSTPYLGGPLETSLYI